MGTEREIDALASEAIRDSEMEFFAEAVGKGDTVLDDTGDRSLETIGKGLEGQHEADDDEGGEEDGAEPHEPEAKADGEGKEPAEGRERDDKGQFKPKGEEPHPGRVETAAERGLRGELTGEREKRKAAETELQTLRDRGTESDRRMAALEASMRQMQAPQLKPPAQEQQPEIPDRWLDPEGYDKWRDQQAEARIASAFATERNRVMAGSFAESRAEHGTAFDEAYRAADAIPREQGGDRLLQYIQSAPHPGRALMNWHTQQKARAEIGDNPAAFRERAMAETRESLMKDPEFRKAVLDALQAEARGTDGSPARTATKLPPSLNSARGGGVARADLGDTSDAGLFEDVMTR